VQLTTAALYERRKRTLVHVLDVALTTTRSKGHAAAEREAGDRDRDGDTERDRDGVAVALLEADHDRVDVTLRLGADVTLGAGVRLTDDVTLGAGVRLTDRVTLAVGVRLMDDVALGADVLVRELDEDGPTPLPVSTFTTTGTECTTRAPRVSVDVTITSYDPERTAAVTATDVSINTDCDEFRVGTSHCGAFGTWNASTRPNLPPVRTSTSLMRNS
jgi:hypothetical protein